MFYFIISFFILIIVLFTNVRVFIRNYKGTTKIYTKIGPCYLLIPHKRIINKVKDDTIKNHSINHLKSNIKRYKAYTKLCVIENIAIEHVINDVNPYTNALFYILISNLKAVLENNFKNVYNETYALTHNETRRIDMDGFLQVKTNIFNLCVMGVLHLFRKRK